MRQALLTGCDRAAAQAFREHRIDVLFECAQFYGWRFPFPGIAWITDFQHRHLPQLFGFGAYWKRDLGFRAQIMSRRHVMLSSEDSRSDCEAFFPRSIGQLPWFGSAILPPAFLRVPAIVPLLQSYRIFRSVTFTCPISSGSTRTIAR